MLPVQRWPFSQRSSLEAEFAFLAAEVRFAFSPDFTKPDLVSSTGAPEPQSDTNTDMFLLRYTECPLSPSELGISQKPVQINEKLVLCSNLFFFFFVTGITCLCLHQGKWWNCKYTCTDSNLINRLKIIWN